MKRVIITLVLILTVSVTSLSAQSLLDNPDYKKSIQLKKQSEVAFSDGDYIESTRLANESALYAKKSDEWIAMMLSKYKANSALKSVKLSLDRAVRIKGDINYPKEMEKGRTLYNQASTLYKDEDYINSYSVAMEAFNTLKLVQYIQDKGNLPAAYIVRDIPGNEDCLWRIAEYDFVFGDPLQWEVLYQANKDILPQTMNPDLIVSGLVIKIPSLNGEVRSGTWVNGSIE